MESKYHNIIEPKGPAHKPLRIHIGEYAVSSDPVVISTFLGSCVAVCLFDWKNFIGGMNHILVPGKAQSVSFHPEARFSINAMELLINSMLKLGADRKKIVAKVFGGANVIPGLPEQNSMGSQNAKSTLEFLKNERIKVVAHDLGGYKSRKVFFHTDTGNVYLWKTHSMKSLQIAILEQKKREQLI